MPDSVRPLADSARRAPRRLETVRVTANVAPRTVSFLPERHGAVLLTGKRSEILLVDSVGANAAQNVARQVLGRVPGPVVAETEGSGFPSNGIAVRGLNPTQSIELNVRQDGVIIAADRHYFTRRSDEYPGPGIIPAIGRSVYVSLRAAPSIP